MENYKDFLKDSEVHVFDCYIFHLLIKFNLIKLFKNCLLKSKDQVIFFP